MSANDETTASSATDSEAHYRCLVCNGVGGHMEGCPGTSAYDELRDALSRLLNVIETHECASISCERHSEKHCNCLKIEAKRASRLLDLTPIR